MYSLMLPPFLLLTLAPGMSAETEKLTAAQVECSEQAGEFWRDERKAFCEIEGAIYETDELETPAPELCAKSHEKYLVNGQRSCASWENRSTETPKLRQK